MIALFGRYASSVVQKAHARVTRENARYVREAIEKDAEVERLTQERDAALLAAAEARNDLGRANAYVTELEEALRQRDEDHAQVSGQLQDALERLAGYEVDRA